MPESRDLIECPVCRSQMSVPRRGGTTAFTCRNGHRYLHEFPERPISWLPRASAVTLLIAAVVIALIIAASHWPAHVPFIRVG